MLFRGESGGLPVPRGETGGVFFSPPLLLSMAEWGLSAVSSRGRKSEASDILLSSRVLSNVPESPNASAVRNIPFPPFFPVPSPPPMPARFSGFTSGFLDASSDAPDASPEASPPAGVSNLSELVVPLRWKLSTREKSSSRSTVVSIAPSLAAATAAACLGLRRLPRDRVPVWWSKATESGDFRRAPPTIRGDGVCLPIRRTPGGLGVACANDPLLLALLSLLTLLSLPSLPCVCGASSALASGATDGLRASVNASDADEGEGASVSRIRSASTLARYIPSHGWSQSLSPVVKLK